MLLVVFFFFDSLTEKLSDDNLTHTSSCLLLFSCVTVLTPAVYVADHANWVFLDDTETRVTLMKKWSRSYSKGPSVTILLSDWPGSRMATEDPVCVCEKGKVQFGLDFKN